MKKISLCLTLFFCSWIYTLLACTAQLPSVNVNGDGVALKGYDPVAYFTVGHPVKGREEFQYEWNNAKWRFSSPEHLAMFKQDPEKYAPQYGGY